MEWTIPQGTQMIRGIPQGVLDNLLKRVAALEAGGGGSFTGATETSTTTPNSSTRVFPFAHAPKVIFWNGLKQKLTTDYTVTGTLQITFVNDGAHTPLTGDLVENLY